MKRSLILLLGVLFIIQSASFAQSERINLAGRHSIFFDGGFKTNSTTSAVVSAGTVDTKTGFVGGLNYGYWFDNEWALTFGAGVFGAEASTKFNGVETSAIVPLLFGIRYYPERLALGNAGRFYASMSLGQYIGFATRVKTIYSTETISESVFGGEAAAGIDLFIASWFKIGPKFSYHFLSDYSEVIGMKKNLSGAAFSIEFGFVL